VKQILLRASQTPAHGYLIS